MKKKTQLTPYILVSGAFLILFALTIFPLLYSLILSFHEWNMTKPAPWKFVGFQNYWEILKDPVFWRVIRNTFIFTFSTVSLQFAIGLGLAHLFNKEIRGEGVVRSTLVLPMMVPSILVGLMWLFMYKRDFGIINYLLGLLNINPIAWLSTSWNSMAGIIIADIWQWTPFMFLLLLAGLRSLPTEIFESARIDGASSLQIFRHVTLPLLRPFIAIALIIRSMDAFREFDKIFQLTGGGPGIATETISLFIYRNGLRYFKMGYAAALSYLTLIIIITVSTLYVRFLQRKGENN
jgi:multiple sugar transport system permease protein